MSNHPEVKWRKASFSDASQTCVEVAESGDGILLRDSKNPDQGHFTFARAEIAAFIAGVKAGEFDDLE
jgi:hypothetical protein